MVEKDFYISLPSNASLNEYPKNKQSNYATVLDTPIELSSKYMVCLKEISNFSDFNVSMCTISFQNVFFTALEHRKSDVNFNFFIKNGTNLQQFCDSINTEITKNFLKQEYLIRYKLAYTSELNRACSDLNYKKKETKIPKFNLIKKINQNLETFELIDSDISYFSTIFRNCGAVYVKDRFVFKTLKALNALFDLIIITAPQFEDLEKEYNKNFFYQDRIDILNQNTVLVQKQLSTKQLKRSHSLEEIIDSEKNEKTISKRNIDSLKSTNLIQTPILPTFKYQNSNRIEIDSSFSKLKINGLLANFLNNSKITELTLKTKESFYLPTKIHPTKFIVIYSDIYEPQYYGNIKSPILRTVNIRSENDENTVYFDNPHYLNVNRTRIDTINIQLCDLAGKHIQFRDNFSSIHLTLHFKKKNE
jgi:hypothetical protein